LRKNKEAYDLLATAKDLSYEKARENYMLFVRRYCYDKYTYDEYSVACYWTGRFEEGKEYLTKIIDDSDFQNQRERFDDNMKHFNNQLAIMD